MIKILSKDELQQVISVCIASGQAFEFVRSRPPSSPYEWNSSDADNLTLYFMHPAKCAGLDFTNSFSTAVTNLARLLEMQPGFCPPPRLVSLDYLRNEADVSHFMKTLTLNPGSFYGVHDSSLPLSSLLSFASHRDPKNALLLASWRDPVDRFVSLIYYYLDHGVFGSEGCDFSYERIASDPDFDNYLTRFFSDEACNHSPLCDHHVESALSNLLALGVFPTTSRVLQSLQAAKTALFGAWRLPCLVKNARLNQTSLEKVPDHMQRSILEEYAETLCSLDKQLSKCLQQASDVHVPQLQRIAPLTATVPDAGLHPLTVLSLALNVSGKNLLIDALCFTDDLLPWLNVLSC